ncbi:MAG: IS1595 family transposase [Bryobacteraceae bacterium]|jgi:transposase-like protein
MSEHATLRDAILYFADFEHCHQFMVELRWPDGKVKCPQCGSDKVCYLAKNRVWKCYATHPKPRFTLKTGTIFEDSPIPLEKWLPAVWMLLNSKNGISSWELHRSFGVTQKTAWFMLHRIRLAMQETSFRKMSGTVEADETLIGGKAGNMHLDKVARIKMSGANLRRGCEGGKAIVMGLLERETKQARAKVLPNVRGYYVRGNVMDNVERGSRVYTDSLMSYRNLPSNGFVHDFVDHTERYVNGQVHTNGLENFWSLLKRALKGTYVSVEPFHLQAYCDEQVFRYNNRKLSDLERFITAMRQVIGRRLTYKELIGTVEMETACG